jgi:threonine dehydratase
MTILELKEPDLEELTRVHERIRTYVHRTPVLTSESINQIAGIQLFFKCENLQKVGAFKFRGACNALLSMSEEELSQGVATHSSGNHAQALALAARIQGVSAYIVMPSTAPAVKKAAVAGYGAEIIECDPTLEAREEALGEVCEKTGALFIPPFDDYRIIAGQATAAMELFEENEDLDALITPVGGGGLLAGSALAAKYSSPQTQVFAGEPEGADDAYRSFESGKRVLTHTPNTIADGLLTTLGEKNFEIIRREVQAIITVSDKEIIDAMKLLWERMKIVVEPSGAVPFAAILKSREQFYGKKVGVILSGGNVDLSKLPF